MLWFLLFCLQDKLLNSMTQEAPELADSGQASCVTCLESRAVMMVFPCNHTALCRLCFVKMIKHVILQLSQCFYSGVSRAAIEHRSINTFSYSFPKLPLCLPSLSLVVLAAGHQRLQTLFILDLFTLIKKVSKVKPSRQKINYGFANTREIF